MASEEKGSAHQNIHVSENTHIFTQTIFSVNLIKIGSELTKLLINEIFITTCHRQFFEYILCTISLAISYVSYLFVLIFVKYLTISIAMTRAGSQANETMNLQTISLKYAFGESKNCRRGQ